MGNMKVKTKPGKWSVGLTIFFLIAIVTSIVLVNVLGILSFDDTWWDVTVAVVFPAEIIAFIWGIIAIKKKDNSVLVYSSVAIGLLTILFILLHSLFISD
jgi:hypothetical protein